MNCVILAGGLGTRMSEYTRDAPKALIPVQGRPFLYHQLKLLEKNGVKNVIISAGYKASMIEEFIAEVGDWGLKIECVDEGQPLKGTGGALRNLSDLGKLPEEFFVLYGDSYLPIDFVSVWNTFKKRRTAGLMTILKNEGEWDKSNVVYKNGVLELYDKFNHDQRSHEMQFIDYGLSILTQNIVDSNIPAGGTADLADLYYRLSKQKELDGFEVTERFYEIGSISGLSDFSEYLAGQNSIYS